MTNRTLSPTLILSCFLASCLEIYDFVLFVFLGKILHNNYLGFLDNETATLIGYALFSIGFIFRPLGSLLFGYIGDVYGRKTALTLSIALMGSASLIMVILPPYAVLGLGACYIIVLVRIIQGLSVGGEFSGAIIFAVEHSAANRVGLVAGIISAGGACGVLLAKLVTGFLLAPGMPEYSWRFAFLLGFSLSGVSYFIRRRLRETPIFNESKKFKFPILVGLKKCKIESFAALFAAAANGAAFYFGSVYLTGFLTQIHPDMNFNFVSPLISITVALLLPIFGMLSDNFNRNIYLLVTSLIMAVIALIVPKLLVEASDIVSIWMLLLLYAMAAALTIGGINIFAVEIFPPAYRMSTSSLFYSLGMGLIGGTVPMVASLLRRWLGDNPLIIGGYISVICLLAAVGSILVHLKQRKISLMLQNR